jgi:myosin heavy subunit
LLGQTLKHMETTKTSGEIPKAFTMGKTRSYLRAGSLEYLENECSKVWDRWACKIQKIAHGWLAKRMILRQKYKKFASAVCPIQRLVRIAFAKQKTKILRADFKDRKEREAAIDAEARAEQEKIDAVLREAQEQKNKEEREE